MRITFSTILQVLGLIAQDVLAYEAEQKSLATPKSQVKTPLTTDNQTPVA